MSRLRARIAQRSYGFKLNKPVDFPMEMQALRFMKKHLIGSQPLALCLLKCKNDVKYYMDGKTYYQVCKYKRFMKLGPGKQFLIAFDKTKMRIKDNRI